MGPCDPDYYLIGCKLQTRPLVRKGAPQDEKILYVKRKKKIKFVHGHPRGAQHQDGLVNWPLAARINSKTSKLLRTIGYLSWTIWRKEETERTTNGITRTYLPG
jgi:hypothetical protein